MNSGDCVSCGFPINVSSSGQTIACPSCEAVNQAISAVPIPTPIFAGLVGLVIGVVFGPALISSTTGGARWLEKKAQERLSR